MRTVHLVLVAAIVASCWGAPLATLRPPRIPTPAPTATPATARPSIIRVTPSPTPTPGPSPSPTPIPGPTFTADDNRIDALIRLGFVEMLGVLAPMVEPHPNMGDIFTSAREFASRTQASLAEYAPSPCTERAFQLFSKSMRLLEEVSQTFLDWVARGKVGPFDGSPVGTAATRANAAFESLEASC